MRPLRSTDGGDGVDSKGSYLRRIDFVSLNSRRESNKEEEDWVYSCERVAQTEVAWGERQVWSRSGLSV